MIKLNYKRELHRLLLLKKVYLRQREPHLESWNTNTNTMNIIYEYCRYQFKFNFLDMKHPGIILYVFFNLKYFNYNVCSPNKLFGHQNTND